MRFRFQRCLSLVAALFALACSHVSAQSGGTWVLDHYAETVTLTSEIGTHKPLPPTAAGPSLTYTWGGMHVSASGTFTPVFRWTGNSTQVVPKLLVLISASATASNSSANPSLTPDSAFSATDGMNDPCVAVGTAPNVSEVSSGNNLIQTNVPPHLPSGTLISLRPITISASATNTVLSQTASLQISARYCPAEIDGYSTVDTATANNPWDPRGPRFFSGTNCSVTGTALPISGYLKTAKLLIGGTTVLSLDYTGQNKTTATLTAHFDSSHFANNTTVTAEMDVTDTGGYSYKGTLSAPAYNMAYTLGNASSLDFGAAAAQMASGIFSGINWSSSGAMTGESKQAIRDNIPKYTGFYIWTHGFDIPSSFGDCFFDPDTSGPGDLVFAYSSDDPTGDDGVSEAISSKTLNQPPYNFVFMDACSTANNQTMSNAFGISALGVTDRTCVGYATTADDNLHDLHWSTKFMQDLTSGMTVAASGLDANKVVGKPTDANAFALARCWGDPATTIHNVYGWHTPLVAKWYLPY